MSQLRSQTSSTWITDARRRVAGLSQQQQQQQQRKHMHLQPADASLLQLAWSCCNGRLLLWLLSLYITSWTSRHCHVLSHLSHNIHCHCWCDASMLNTSHSVRPAVSTGIHWPTTYNTQHHTHTHTHVYWPTYEVSFFLDMSEDRNSRTLKCAGHHIWLRTLC